MALPVQMAYSFPSLQHYSQAVQPSESLSDVRCAIWRGRHSQDSLCPDAAALATIYFPNLTQRPATLYIPWFWCAYTMFGDGFNVEYQPSRRAVVIHCYLTRPYVWRQPLTSIAAMEPTLSLLLVPTASLPSGPVSVIEDSRIEHLVGDQSTEYQTRTATIS
jgi:hypothetical protein